MPAKPMLAGIPLQQVQQIESSETETLVRHAVPALEGDFLQDFGRRAARIRITGVLTGATSDKDLDTLHGKFRAATPVAFVADIATATRTSQMLIERMWSRELAGKPGRFEYGVSLVEHIGQTKPKTAPPFPKPALPNVRSGKLRIQVAAAQAFDPRDVTVLVEGTAHNGETASRFLRKSSGSVWAGEDLPSGKYQVKVAIAGTHISGSSHAVVSPAQTARVAITAQPGLAVARAFTIHFAPGKSFVESGMFGVIKQVTEHARSNPAEKIFVAGHADSGSDPEHAQPLSEQRARAVFTALTYGNDPHGLLNEWNAIRMSSAAHRATRWGSRESELILEDLGYYQGPAEDGTQSVLSLRDFQLDHDLAVDGVVSESTWSALLAAYLERKAVALPRSHFLPKPWTGLGIQSPVKNTADAWRPNRRVEVLFFPAGTQPTDLTAWVTTPAEPESVIVRGSINLEDGTPLPRVTYELIAPDGECMDGEQPAGPHRGYPLPGHTAEDGTFHYPLNPKGAGIYTLNVIGNVTARYVARLTGDTPSAAKGSAVSKRLDESSSFDVTVSPQ